MQDDSPATRYHFRITHRKEHKWLSVIVGAGLAAGVGTNLAACAGRVEASNASCLRYITSPVVQVQYCLQVTLPPLS